MKGRYKVGFEDGVNCMWLADNPGRVAIVDTDSPFVNGECVAIADSDEIARKIVFALNFCEHMKDVIIPKQGL